MSTPIRAYEGKPNDRQAATATACPHRRGFASVLLDEARSDSRGRWRELHDPAQRALWLHRRKWLRQNHHDYGGAAPDQAAGQDREWSDHPRWSKCAGTGQGSAAPNTLE